MRLSLLIFSLFYSAMSQAAAIEFPSEGIYKAKSFEVLLAIRHVIVPIQSANYSERIQDLKNLGYTCGYTSMWATKCTKREVTAEIPDFIEDKVHEKWFGFPLEINDMREDPTQTISGDSYEEWAVAQEVKFKGKSFPQYRLMVTDKIKKLALGQTYAGAEFYFNYTQNSHQFESIIQETQTLSRFEFVSFLIAVKFK